MAIGEYVVGNYIVGKLSDAVWIDINSYLRLNSAFEDDFTLIGTDFSIYIDWEIRMKIFRNTGFIGKYGGAGSYGWRLWNYMDSIMMFTGNATTGIGTRDYYTGSITSRRLRYCWVFDKTAITSSLYDSDGNYLTGGVVKAVGDNSSYATIIPGGDLNGNLLAFRILIYKRKLTTTEIANIKNDIIPTDNLLLWLEGEDYNENTNVWPDHRGSGYPYFSKVAGTIRKIKWRNV